MVEVLVLYGLTMGVVGEAATDAWNKLPLIVSAIVAMVGIYMGWQARLDGKKKDEAKVKLDTLTIGQEWVVQALNMAKADNVQLRETLIQQQHDHEEVVRGWQEKVEHQEDEIIALKNDNTKLAREHDKLTIKYERLEREMEALKRKLETP